MSTVQKPKDKEWRSAIATRLQFWAEAVVLLAAVYFFWYPSRFPAPSLPGSSDRADYVWLLGVFLVLVGTRFLVHGRLWTRTPLDLWLAAFIVLGLVNVIAAPYPSRGPLMLARPLLGMALVMYLVEVARQTGRIDYGLGAAVALALIVGMLALGGTQWVPKTDYFQVITSRLPQIRGSFLPGGFNPNEIAGALAWLTPLMIGLAFYPWRRWQAMCQGLCAGLGVILLIALFLGQSRFAIAGVLLAVAGFALLCVPVRPWRYVLLSGVILLTIAQAALIFSPLPGEDANDDSLALSGRDERTISQRAVIWNSAFAMIRDHPLTGVGMDRFRYSQAQRDYPIVGISAPPPHAHNMFIQIATDLGLPGLVVLVGWKVAAGYMLWTCWHNGNQQSRVAAVAIGSGLLAHVVYGLGDAIPLWDRFSFVYWFMLGLAAAHYTVNQRTRIEFQSGNGNVKR
jgi:putative inorganic carbon (hco3(-)) transporter